MHPSKNPVLLILGVFLVVYLLPLGQRPMVTRDEFRYAEIPREMIDHGDWVLPRIDGLDYFEKPVLGYWLNALSLEAFGQNAFAVRLSSALAAGLTALLILFLVREERSTALLAAVILLTSLQFFGTAIYAVLDGPLTLMITGTMVSFYEAWAAERKGRQRAFLALAGAFCGGAFLIKGFISLVVPVLSIGLFLLLRKTPPGKYLGFALIPAAVAAIVSLPWSLLIAGRSADFWPYFFWTEHIQRFLSPSRGQHPQPIWYYIPVFAVGAFPWTLTLFPAFRGLRELRRKAPVLVFCACWFFATFLFFSLSSGKLPTYIVPAFPPFAVLTAFGLKSYFAAGGRKAWLIGLRAWSGLLLIGGLAVLLQKEKLYDGPEQWRAVLLAISLLLSAGFALNTSFRKKTGAAPTWFAAGMIPLFLAFHFILPLRDISHKTPGDFIRRHRGGIKAATTVISDNFIVHAACWVLKRDDIFVLGKPGELGFGFSVAEGPKRNLLADDLSDFFSNATSEKIVYLGEKKVLRKFRKLLPSPDFEEQEGKLAFVEWNLRGESSGEGVPESNPGETVQEDRSMTRDGSSGVQDE